MTERKLVFIASPYAGDVERNLKFARAACRYCIEQGHTPIVPHLIYPQILDDSNPVERALGIKLGHHLMEICEDFWQCGDLISTGMEGDIQKAGELGLPIQHVSRQQILDPPNPVYAIWAKGRPDSPLAGQSGFLCENRQQMCFPSREEAEVRIRDIRNLCLNNRPAAEFKCLEYPPDYASELRMHLETIADLDMVPAFDPNGYKVKSRVYGNTGGGCMVGTVQFYLPELDKPVWVNCNDECATITSADHIWNEDQSGSWERYDDVLLYYTGFEQEVPEEARLWLPMIKEALAYTIGQETASARCDGFSLPVAWVPDAIRQKAEPEYLAWLQAEGKEIRIGQSGAVEIDASYPQSASEVMSLQ